MSRVYNFSHSAAAVPESVLNIIQNAENLMFVADTSANILAHSVDRHQENMVSNVYDFSDDSATVPEWILNSVQADEALPPVTGKLSGNTLARPVDSNWFGSLYASAQKKLESAGVTIVVLREDLMPFTATELPFLAQHRGW